MYVCQYDNETGTKVKKEALDFQFIDDTFYKKSNRGPTENNSLPTKVIHSSFANLFLINRKF